MQMMPSPPESRWQLLWLVSPCYVTWYHNPRSDIQAGEEAVGNPHECQSGTLHLKITVLKNVPCIVLECTAMDWEMAY